MANARKPTRLKEKRTVKVHNYRLLQVLSRQFPTLTQTERIVCDLLAMHLRTKEIAEKMGIGARTVETHRQNIRRKLGLPKGKELSAFLCSI
ncbi:MAG: response regulator transcription factor [Chloroherpetonaceae bacterium]